MVSGPITSSNALQQRSLRRTRGSAIQFITRVSYQARLGIAGQLFAIIRNLPENAAIGCHPIPRR